MIRLPSEILTALETVLDYCWNDESRSYEETPEEDRRHHIFNSLKIMQGRQTIHGLPRGGTVF